MTNGRLVVEDDVLNINYLLYISYYKSIYYSSFL